MKPVTVSQLNGYIKRIMATDPILSNICVSGEVSGLTFHESGHWYFSIKDENSRLNCFLPRDRAARVRFPVENGMKIIAFGSVSVFERGGTYSLNIREIEVEGEGDLKRAYEILKKKLGEEGLFDPKHKRIIPSYPKNIGVVTSPTGAAVRDIINTVKRRNPTVNIMICPCLVQGPDAAASISAAIKELNEGFPYLDLIICGRGGGSAEDLWCFNEEETVRAVYNSRIPVISAVGHEIDHVLTDLSADLRAATPTAAAELAVPDIEGIKDRLRQLDPSNMYTVLKGLYETAMLRTEHCLEGAYSAVQDRINRYSHRLDMLRLDAESYDPMNLLQKGYTVIKKSDGSWAESAGKIIPGDKIRIIFKDGFAEALITSTEVKNGNK